MMKTATTAIAVAIAALFMMTSGAGAAGDPIKARQDIMDGFKKQMKILGPMMQGATAFDAKAVEAAGIVFETGLDKIAGLFPDGVTSDESEVSPKVWSDRKGFEAAAATARGAATAVKKIGADDNEFDFAPAAAALGKACKGCHKQYRQRKEEK